MRWGIPDRLKAVTGKLVNIARKVSAEETPLQAAWKHTELAGKVSADQDLASKRLIDRVEATDAVDRSTHNRSTPPSGDAARTAFAGWLQRIGWPPDPSLERMFTETYTRALVYSGKPPAVMTMIHPVGYNRELIVGVTDTAPTWPRKPDDHLADSLTSSTRGVTHHEDGSRTVWFCVNDYLGSPQFPTRAGGIQPTDPPRRGDSESERAARIGTAQQQFVRWLDRSMWPPDRELRPAFTEAYTDAYRRSGEPPMVTMRLHDAEGSLELTVDVTDTTPGGRSTSFTAHSDEPATETAGTAATADPVPRSGPGRGRDLIGELDYASISSAVSDRADAVGDPALALIYREQGFDGRPAVVGADELDAVIASGGREFFRGVEPAHTEAFKYGDEHFPGIASPNPTGNGTYVTTSREVAGQYAEGNPDGVMRMALRPDARIADLTQLRREHSEAMRLNTAMTRMVSSYEQTPQVVERLESLEQKRKVLADLGRFAAARGYDAYPTQGGAIGHLDQYWVILNREAVVVQR